MSEISKTVRGIPDYNTYKFIRVFKKKKKIKCTCYLAKEEKNSELKHSGDIIQAEISLTEVQLYSVAVTHRVCAFKAYCWRNLWKLADKLMWLFLVLQTDSWTENSLWATQQEWVQRHRGETNTAQKKSRENTDLCLVSVPPNWFFHFLFVSVSAIN